MTTASKEITLKIDGIDVDYIRKDSVSENYPDFTHGVFVKGRKYVIRTVTMIDIGECVYVDDKFIILVKAAWIADTGRYSDFLSGKCPAKEIEMYAKPCGVGIGAIIDFTEFVGELPNKTV